MTISKITEKKYYTVRVECLLPGTLTYRVLAESPEQALTLVKHQAPIQVQHRLVGRKNLKATVYDMGTTMIRLVKNLVGLSL